VARGWKNGHTPPGGRTKRDLFYLKGMGVYFMKRMVVQKLSRYNNYSYNSHGQEAIGSMDYDSTSNGFFPI